MFLRQSQKNDGIVCFPACVQTLFTVTLFIKFSKKQSKVHNNRGVQSLHDEILANCKLLNFTTIFLDIQSRSLLFSIPLLAPPHDRQAPLARSGFTTRLAGSCTFWHAPMDLTVLKILLRHYSLEPSVGCQDLTDPASQSKEIASWWCCQAVARR